MDKSSTHGMNNGLQGSLLWDVYYIPLQRAVEYSRQHKVPVAGKICHMVVAINISANQMKRWRGPKPCSHVGSICALY
jgi:hypothetical protein